VRRLPDRGDAPKRLAKGAAAATKLVIKYIAAGAKPRWSALYGCKEVRDALEALQAGRCSYCEGTLAPVCIGHIEHFRPKGAVTDLDGAVVSEGYFWLAYEWTNLLLACEVCNVKWKGTRFPLAGEANRATNPASDLKAEAPLLVDPYGENPRDFVRFRSSVAYAVEGNPRGQACIDVYGLNREPLERARREHIHLVRTLGAIIDLAPDGPTKEEALALYQEMTGERAMFSACIRDYLQGGG
jgi:uncharacterized protein (TIGR02646 family)